MWPKDWRSGGIILAFVLFLVLLLIYNNMDQGRGLSESSARKMSPLKGRILGRPVPRARDKQLADKTKTTPSRQEGPMKTEDTEGLSLWSDADVHEAGGKSGYSTINGVRKQTRNEDAGVKTSQGVKVDGASLKKGDLKTNELKKQAGKKEKKVLKRPEVPTRSERWIVLTTIQLPTDAVRTMASKEGWSVVAVGDRKTPPDWKLDNCVFLSVERQAQLGYKVHDLIPYRHYARKNIGYLYAIQHGAKVIYDTDDDNELIVDSLEESFILNLDNASMEDMLLLEPQQGHSSQIPTVNPYVHFGQPNMWPRGFPLAAIDPANTVPFKYRHVSRDLKPYVQQGLANGDPDVDAFFRLTRKRGGAKIDLTFDRTAPPITYPRGLLVPFNTQNTIVHQQAFWGLLVPITTTFRVCDIWRGYWFQRALWEIGGTLSFHTASVYQDRNEHNYFFDHVDEYPLYNNSRQLIHFLLDWRPPQGKLFSRIRDLSIKMAEQGFWKAGDVTLMKAWLSDLEAVGYKPPAVLESRSPIARGPDLKYVPNSFPTAYLYAPL